MKAREDLKQYGEGKFHAKNIYINIGHVDHFYSYNIYGSHAKPEAEEGKKGRGKPQKTLFTSASSTHGENMETRKREAKRLEKYLREHRLSGQLLTTQHDTKLTSIVVAFVRQWQRLKLVGEKPSGAALFRFLTTDVGLGSEVTDKTFSNKFGKMLERVKPSVETERGVSKAFQ